MGYAEAFLFRDHIAVRTVSTRDVNDFDFMLAACKKVLGGNFNPRRKLWTYPQSIDTCHQLRAALGERLRVHDGLAAWYREAKAAASSRAELSGAQDATLTRVPQPFASWLRAYQRVGAQWIAQGYRGAGLVADEPGLGK